MKIIRLVAVFAAAGLAACSLQNKYEREADDITRAVMNNDLRPVSGQIAPGVNIPRVKIAEWSDELNAQGKLVSLKEVTTNCDPGWHCFEVKFEKHAYLEHMRLDESGKVVNWNFKMAQTPMSS